MPDWSSSLSVTGSCDCGCSDCLGCTGQTSTPDYYNVTITITNPGIWDMGAFDWGCGGVMGSELTWDGIMPNDGNCVLDLQAYCPFPLSIPPYVFDYSWFNGRTFRIYTRGTDEFGASFDYAGCLYLGSMKCTQEFDGYLFTTRLDLSVNISSPGSVTYSLTIGGNYNNPSISITIARGSVGTALSWGCSGSSFASASASFDFSSPGPGYMAYGSTSPGGTVAGSFVISP